MNNNCAPSPFRSFPLRPVPKYLLFGESNMCLRFWHPEAKSFLTAPGPRPSFPTTAEKMTPCVSGGAPCLPAVLVVVGVCGSVSRARSSTRKGRSPRGVVASAARVPPSRVRAWHRETGHPRNRRRARLDPSLCPTVGSQSLPHMQSVRKRPTFVSQRRRRRLLSSSSVVLAGTCGARPARTLRTSRAGAPSRSGTWSLPVRARAAS